MPVQPDSRLKDPAELLFRQASPALVQGGVPTSLLFKPMPKDHGQLSVDRESVIGSAEKSRARFLARGFKSHSTWGVSVGEVEGLSLKAYADASKGNDAHALIDMAALTDRQQRDASKRLREAAVSRGQLAPSPDSASPQLPAPRSEEVVAPRKQPVVARAGKVKSPKREER